MIIKLLPQDAKGAALLFVCVTSRPAAECRADNHANKSMYVCYVCARLSIQFKGTTLQLAEHNNSNTTATRCCSNISPSGVQVLGIPLFVLTRIVSGFDSECLLCIKAAFTYSRNTQVQPRCYYITALAGQALKSKFISDSSQHTIVTRMHQGDEGIIDCGHAGCTGWYVHSCMLLRNVACRIEVRPRLA